MRRFSLDFFQEFDYLPQPADNDHLHPVKCFFRPDEIREYITHPYASPLFGDLHGLPPLLIQCGDAERLRDEGTLLAHKACLAGVQVEHEIYEDCVHVFQVIRGPFCKLNYKLTITQKKDVWFSGSYN